MQALRLAARRAAGEALLECSTSGRQPGALAQACRAFSAAAAELAPGGEQGWVAGRRTPVGLAMQAAAAAAAACRQCCHPRGLPAQRPPLACCLPLLQEASLWQPSCAAAWAASQPTSLERCGHASPASGACVPTERKALHAGCWQAPAWPCPVSCAATLLHVPTACRRCSPTLQLPLQGGKTPGIVFSGPGEEQQLLAFDATSLSKLVTKLGRTAWACTIFNLQVRRDDGSSATLRALVRPLRLLCDPLGTDVAWSCCMYNAAARHSTAVVPSCASVHMKRTGNVHVPSAAMLLAGVTACSEVYAGAYALAACTAVWHMIPAACIRAPVATCRGGRCT